jgi:hypothetical protein
MAGQSGAALARYLAFTALRDRAAALYTSAILAGNIGAAQRAQMLLRQYRVIMDQILAEMRDMYH